jgi:serine/threonine protein kinase
MDARIGQQLGNYRLIRLLGQGGFADVYLGEHVYLGTQAALKVLQVRLMGEHLELFRNEARTIASLVHPNIVRVFDFGVEAGTPFLVMDYAPHGSLRQRYTRGSIVPPQQIVASVKQVAAALHYAHQRRFIHRDVKPENMLLGMNDEILLSDFGLVLVEQSTSSQITREAAGTLPYMAPEQLQGKPRAASDQYALGIVVYEWLCGERPFRGGPMELMGQHALTPPPSLRQRVPTIPHTVETVVLKALSKEPQERFADVQAFATELEIACREVLAQPFPAADSPTNLRTPLNPTLSREVFPGVLTQTPIGVNPTPQNQDSGSMLAPIYEEREPRDMVISASHISQPGDPTPLSPEAFPLSTGTAPSSAGADLRERRISRRVVIASVAAVIGLGGSILTIGWASSAGLLGTHSSSTPTTTPGGTVHATSTPSSSTSTPPPLVFPSLLYTYTGHSDRVRAVAWSPDDQYIASAAGNVSFNPPAKDQTVQVWDATNGSHVYTYHGKGTSLYGYGASAAAWSPGSKRIVAGVNDQSVEIWNALDGGNEVPYPGYGSLVNTVAWSPDGSRIASGYEDGKVKIWDAAGGGLIKTYLWIPFNACHALAWSPDSVSLAAANYDGTVQIWNTATGGQLVTLGQQDQGGAHGLYAITWSPDGKRIASGGLASPVRVWNVAEKTMAFIYAGHSGSIAAVSWSPNGTYIASGGDDNTAQVWKATDGTHVFTYSGHKQAINALAWSPTSKRVASASNDQTVQVWRIA